MNVFGVGPTEIFVVLIVILVLFGPEKLPELAKKIGGASREIRENLNSVSEQMNSALETSMELDKARMIPPAAPAAEVKPVENRIMSDDALAQLPPALPDTVSTLPDSTVLVEPPSSAESTPPARD